MAHVKYCSEMRLEVSSTHLCNVGAMDADCDMRYHVPGPFSDMAVDATLMQRVAAKLEMVAKVATRLSHGHVHVDFAHINTACRFVHLFFSYFHLPTSPSNWVPSRPLMLPPTLVSLQAHVMCGSAFALTSCNSHKAVEAFLLMYWPICGLCIFVVYF